jgi:cobalt-zinc-cadmium efflux system protein
MSGVSNSGAPHGHDAGHAHGHDGHGHHHAPATFDAAFAIGTALNLVIVVAELVFGYLAGSLALMADGAHNFADVLGLLMAWGSSRLGRKQPTKSRTYGYGRSTILAALGNGVLLVAATGAIIAEAVRRFAAPEPVAVGTVILVGLVGILANGGTALLFLGGRQHDVNVRGAFLHMAADALVSLGVVVAAVLIHFTGWLWLDPAISIAIAAIVLAGTWGLLRDAGGLMMDAVPSGIDRDAVEAYLGALGGVTEVHDLHIWALSTTQTALTAHLVRPSAALDDGFLTHTAAELKQRFGIDHATFQVEAGDPAHPCHLAPSDVV